MHEHDQRPAKRETGDAHQLVAASRLPYLVRRHLRLVLGQMGGNPAGKTDVGRMPH